MKREREIERKKKRWEKIYRKWRERERDREKEKEKKVIERERIKLEE